MNKEAVKFVADFYNIGEEEATLYFSDEIDSYTFLVSAARKKARTEMFIEIAIAITVCLSIYFFFLGV